MGYKVMPSIGMLPMEDIYEALKLVGFLTDISPEDLEKATRKEIIEAGVTTTLPGIWDVHNIAVSTGAIVNGTIDRETVKNALNLNNRAANEYLTLDDKKSLLQKNSDISQIYSNEIKLLRDELYNIKAELGRRGLIDDTDVAKGFIDYFKNSNLRFSTASTEIASIENNSLIQANNIFEYKDWIVVHKDKNNEETVFVDEVTKKIGSSIELKNGISNINIRDSLLRKSIGEYKNDTYSFSKTLYGAVSTKERYTILNDDVDMVKDRIKRSNSGFATVIRIPNRNTGYLSKLVLQGEKVGNPGSLICYVVPGNVADIINLAKDNKLTESIVNNTVLVKSMPVNEYDKVNKEISFDFKNISYDIGQHNTTPYAEVLGGNEYCFIIEANNVSEEDYWILEFGTNKGDDLQTNNKTFVFNRNTIENNGLEEIESLNSEMDLFYTVVTKDIDEEAEIPFKNGLYTVSEPIKIQEPLLASRARLTLEVNKEGVFVSKSKGVIRERLDSLEFRDLETGNVAEQTVIGAGDSVVAGNELANVVTATPGSITLDKSIYIDEMVPVYRVGYKAQLKVKMVVKDENTHLPTTVNGSERIYPLNLIAIIPSGRKIDSRITDRLIFEADLSSNDDELEIADKCDFDGDGIVTTNDLTMLVSNYGNTNPEILKKFDLNGDGAINIADSIILNKYINHKVGNSLNSELLFNEATLQISWGSNLSSEAARLQLAKGKDYVGRIKNLNLSFDRII